jgi:ubiquinone/menaquinone biosynthesis C-methylase UbiE
MDLARSRTSGGTKGVWSRRTRSAGPATGLKRHPAAATNCKVRRQWQIETARRPGAGSLERSMPSIDVLRTLVREIVTSERAQRVTEPDLVMDDPAKVAAYVEAGRPNGVMAPVYVYHSANACEVIRPGDRVIDLACGPANQLAMIAAMNPEARFVGVDLSPPMLARASEHVARLGLQNVELRMGDISRLDWLESGSVDAIISTMALHHRPTREHLNRVFEEAARVLREDGGMYVVDFGHLKSEASIRYFAHQYADRQPELFTLDYLYSLRAAFRAEDFRAASAVLGRRARLFTTFIAPYMVAIKSARRRAPEPPLRQRVRELTLAMPRNHQADLRDLATFFRLGGMSSALLQ